MIFKYLPIRLKTELIIIFESIHFTMNIFILWFPIFSCRSLLYENGPLAYFMSDTEVDITETVPAFKGFTVSQKGPTCKQVVILSCQNSLEKQPESGWNSEDLFGAYNPQGRRVRKTVSKAGKMGNNAK